MRRPKLVRDLIPRLLRERGIEPITHVAESPEYASRLADKLVEEALEYRTSSDVEELADALEVIYAIAEDQGIGRDELERLRTAKANSRRGFKDRTVLDGPLDSTKAEEHGSQGCLACDANEGRVQAPGGVIYADGDWILEHSLSPVLLRGWLILKPRRHVEHIADLTTSERTGLGPLLARASSSLKRALGAERVYVCSFGESVNHVHFYLVPRYSDMPADGIGVLNAMFSSDHPWSCDNEAAATAATKVREALVNATS